MQKVSRKCWDEMVTCDCGANLINRFEKIDGEVLEKVVCKPDKSEVVSIIWNYEVDGITTEIKYKCSECEKITTITTIH